MTNTPTCPTCDVPAAWAALLTQPQYRCPLCDAVVEGETA